MSIDNYIDFNPVTIAPDILLKDAVISLAHDKANCLLVVAAEKLVGILTQGDVIRLVATGIDLATTTVEQVMTQPVLTMLESQCHDFASVRSFFQQHSANYLPIARENRELIGVIDACSFFGLIQAEETVNNNENLANINEKEEAKRFFNLANMQCIAGLDGYFKRVNAAFSKILGFTAEELLAEPLVNFIHPEDRAATIAEVEKLTKGKTTFSFENRYRTKNGEYRWLLWTAKAYLDEGLIYAAGQDISEQQATLRDRNLDSPLNAGNPRALDNSAGRDTAQVASSDACLLRRLHGVNPTTLCLATGYLANRHKNS